MIRIQLIDFRHWILLSGKCMLLTVDIFPSVKGQSMSLNMTQKTIYVDQMLTPRYHDRQQHDE